MQLSEAKVGMRVKKPGEYKGTIKCVHGTTLCIERDDREKGCGCGDSWMSRDSIPKLKIISTSYPSAIIPLSEARDRLKVGMKVLVFDNEEWITIIRKIDEKGIYGDDDKDNSDPWRWNYRWKIQILEDAPEEKPMTATEACLTSSDRIDSMLYAMLARDFTTQHTTKPNSLFTNIKNMITTAWKRLTKEDLQREIDMGYRELDGSLTGKGEALKDELLEETIEAAFTARVKTIEAEEKARKEAEKK